ncbi:MAG: DUF3380 domain-containing protein [Myxococcales bacterium]|nr:DUF3380 domain-containing protein [Myxococcales bacterium]
MKQDNSNSRGSGVKSDAKARPTSASKPSSASRGGGPTAAPADPTAGHRYDGGKALHSAHTAATPSGPQASQAGPAQTQMHRQAGELQGAHGAQLASGAARLGVAEESLAAVVLTEQQYLPRAVPALADKMPVRFEPYVFFTQTGRWLVATHRDQAAEYGSFEQARAHNDDAAHRALRMGVGQVSGTEAEVAGFASPQAMHNALQVGPSAQIDALVQLVRGQDDLRTALSAGDWTQTALLRAGPAYGALGYDQTLQVAAQAYRSVKPGGGDDDGEGDKPKKRKKG